MISGESKEIEKYELGVLIALYYCFLGTLNKSGVRTCSSVQSLSSVMPRKVVHSLVWHSILIWVNFECLRFLMTSVICSRKESTIWLGSSTTKLRSTWMASKSKSRVFLITLTCSYLKYKVYKEEFANNFIVFFSWHSLCFLQTNTRFTTLQWLMIDGKY